MNDLRDLYQQLILDHHQHPRNFGVLAEANRSADGNNPLCGDQLHLSVLVEDGTVKDIKFEGSGCAIFKASASIMTTVVKGKSTAEVQDLFDAFHHMATTGEADPDKMGKLAALADVYKYPIRVKCAMLAWRTLTASLENEPAAVSTE